MTDQTTTADGETEDLRVDADRLLRRLAELGSIGGLQGGGCSRLALTDEDRAGRDFIVALMTDLGLRIQVDSVGNVIATTPSDSELAPVMMGSHIDTVATGGLYDGNLGVLAGLEVIETVLSSGLAPRRPLSVGFFSNEEGARFAPDMMGSLVYVGGMAPEVAHNAVAVDGANYGDELRRIGYLGTTPCPGRTPHAYVELHIEQGPVLENESCDIGVVSGVQGISWRRLSVSGQSAHAGTTPMPLRHDAGYVAAAIAVFVRRLASEIGGTQVATVGSIELVPNLINVIASTATMTVDLRNTDEVVLREAEERLDEFCLEIQQSEGVRIEVESLARFEPVEFSSRVSTVIERTATKHGLSSRRLCSGAGHDAQMLARVCDSGMIFVPSVNGISHNVSEFTSDDDNVNGANVLLHVVLELAGER